MWIFLGSSECSLVQKSPMATLFLSSMKFTSKAITQMETRGFRRNRVTKSRRQRQKPAPLALCLERTMKCKPTGILR